LKKNQPPARCKFKIMDRRTIILIAVAGVLVISLLVIGLYAIFRSPEPVQAPEANLNTSNANQPTTGLATNQPPVTFELPQPVEPVVVDQATKDKADIERLARTFTERYGSFSNQTDFENLEDLKIFMTASMRAYVDSFIARQRAQRGDTSIYYGVTTKVLTTEITDYSPSLGRAEVLVTVQKQESTGSTTNTKVFNQEAALDFARDNGSWKLEGLYWK